MREGKGEKRRKEEGKGEQGGGEGRGVLDLPLKYMVTLDTGAGIRY